MTQVILLFPGQGSQTVGMGADVAREMPAAKDVFDRADEALGLALTQLCWDGPEEELKLTHNCQPAITAVNLALAAALRQAGLEVVATAGHSLGEYAADAAAGACGVETAIRLTRTRGELMQACADRRPGSMVAVIGLPMEQVAEICQTTARETGQVVSVANYNSPSQVVITGEKEPVAQAAAALQEAGAKRTVELPVSGPWHCALMQEAQDAFVPVLSDAEITDPALPVYANVDGGRQATAGEIREALARQITGSVHWTQLVANLRADFPEAVYIECGPGKVLRGLMRGIDRDATCYNVEDAAGLQATLDKLGG